METFIIILIATVFVATLLMNVIELVGNSDDNILGILNVLVIILVVSIAIIAFKKIMVSMAR